MMPAGTAPIMLVGLGGFFIGVSVMLLGVAAICGCQPIRMTRPNQVARRSSTIPRGDPFRGDAKPPCPDRM